MSNAGDPRERLDRAVLDYFASAVLDLEATKADVQRALHSRGEEFATLRAQAEKESARAQDRLLRTRRHYQDGRPFIHEPERNGAYERDEASALNMLRRRAPDRAAPLPACSLRTRSFAEAAMRTIADADRRR
jgi:hypothetical protein